MLITELDKQVIAAVSGLYLGGKIIPHQTKGVVSGTNSYDHTIIVNWNVDGEKVQTSIPEDQYDKLREIKAIDEAINHVIVPLPKFKLEDMVKDGCYSGIIKGFEYLPIEKTYQYKVLIFENIFLDGSDRYEYINEKDLILITEAAIEAYGIGKDYIISIKEIASQ